MTESASASRSLLARGWTCTHGSNTSNAFGKNIDTRYSNNPAFSAGEMTQYLAFLNAAAGNTIFLIGENVGFNARNTPINQFIILAGGGTIAVPAANSTASQTVNAPFTGPNSISTVKFAACGLVTSAGNGGFASSEAGGGCSLFFAQQNLTNAPTGALVVVYDVDFIASAPHGGAVNEVAFRQNLEQYVAAPPVGKPPSVPVGVPALGTWGLVLLAAALCGFGVILLRRRSFA